MNIIEALSDPHLFGALPAFADLTTWRPWLVFLRALYGLEMDDADLEVFRTHTGRQAPRQGGYPEAVCITGRQSGKTQVAAIVGAYEAAQASAAGRRGQYVVLAAQDARNAQRALLGYCREAFDVPMLAAEVVRDTAEALELRGGVTLAVYPCRPSALRGIRSPMAILDEAAFYVSSEGRAVDREMLRAVRPCLATTGGKLLILSSPYGQTGLLWDLHRQHFAREESPVLVWTASAPTMNTTLAADYVERMREDDPEAYRSEVLGEFRTGLSTFLEPEALEACVVEGVREREPWTLEAILAAGLQPGQHIERPRYVSFTDAASGSGKDAFTIAVAHAEGGKAVLDVVRAWKPPFNPSGAIAEAAALLRRYGLGETTGDSYAPGFVKEAFLANGITYRPSDRDRSAIYLELLPLVNAGSVVLLDDPELLRELRGLERRRGTSGRDRVDHRPGAHDDRANAAAGALVAVKGGPQPARMVSVAWG